MGVLRPFLAASSALAMLSAGCALVLGGLEEGTARALEDAGSSAATSIDAASPMAASCPGWLAGARLRVPFEVHVLDGGTTQDGVQASITIDTASWVERGTLLAGGQDLRVTAGDGTTIVPHAVESGIGTPETHLTAKIDLRDGLARGFVYHGGDIELPPPSSRSPWVEGVIDDPGFVRGDSWMAAADFSTSGRPPSPTEFWSADVGDGGAHVRIFRQAAQNSAAASVCQTIRLPAGSRYQLEADVDVRIADNAYAAIFYNELQGVVGWHTDVGVVGPVAARTIPLGPGMNLLCLAAVCEGSELGQGADVVYAHPRLRTLVPHAVVLGAEETTPCGAPAVSSP